MACAVLLAGVAAVLARDKVMLGQLQPGRVLCQKSAEHNRHVSIGIQVRTAPRRLTALVPAPYAHMVRYHG